VPCGPPGFSGALALGSDVHAAASLGQGAGQGGVEVGEGGEGGSVGGFLLGGEAERRKKRAWWERPQATPLSDARAAGLFKEALHMPQGAQFTAQCTYFASTKAQILTPEELRARPPALWARAE
jgi:hypothetical protein